MNPAKAFEGRERVHLAVWKLAQETKGQFTLTDGPGVGASTHQRAKPIADFLGSQHAFLLVGEALPQVGDAVRRQSAQTNEQVTPHVTPHVAPHVVGEVTGEVAGEVRHLLSVMAGEMKLAEMQQALGLRHEDHFRDAYLVLHWKQA